MIFMVHLEEEKVPGHGVVDTCSLAGLFPGGQEVICLFCI